MNSKLLGHHHYQLVLVLDSWYRLDWFPKSTDVEYCNKVAQPDQLETHETPPSWCCGMCSRKFHYGLIWHYE